MKNRHNGLTRREFNALGLAAAPALALTTLGPLDPWTFGPLDQKTSGVTLGAITYSFRSIPNVDEIIAAMVKVGLTEAEVMSNHIEQAAGAPAIARGGSRDPLLQWRKDATPATFKAARKKFNDAGIDVRLLCYNMGRTIADEEIEYAFNMAAALGVKAISTSTQVSVAKRIAPFADTHKMMVGFHGHSNITNPDEFATPDSFAAAMAMSKYHGVNLDIGHFTAANFDAVAYLKEHYARITNLHLKDRKKNQGDNVVWGTGDTPIGPVLQLLKNEKWDIPANIEYEYRGDDVVVEMTKCLQFCKDALK